MTRTLSLIPLLLAMAAAPVAAQTARPSEPRPIPIGQAVASQLDESDSLLESGSYYETWTFQARAGQLLVISMGGEFDTILSLGRGAGGEFTEITSNDDSLGSTDSSIEFRVPGDGTYVIRSHSFEKGETGNYVLVVFDAS